jgi:threonylcarbamoyladenosine tRNA methylthiotransferase MtaB
MATPRSVAFYTLGCKLNYSESSAIRRLFEGDGYAVRDFSDGADVYVINTCSVTEFADRKCRSVVRKALGIQPEARVIVMGCYAQLKPEEIARIPGVDLVLGAAEKFRILDYVHNIGDAPGKGMVQAGDIRDVQHFESAWSIGDRTRSFLKVQDGCDYKCTFCTIPLARGKSRSDTIDNILQKAGDVARAGAREIVLTGVNIGDFGNGTEVIEGARPKKEALFIDLIRALDEVDQVDRLRISSIEPNLCTDEIIDFVAASKRFMPHFHMPLQSGNNKQLRAMRRRYKRELYEERVARIREKMPHACIGVDVIVGFPGETEEDFQETFRFLHALDVSYLHIFTYSERPNTPAAEMAGVVPVHVRRQRNEVLRDLSEKKRRYFYEQFAGQTRKVLLEQGKEPGVLNGFTDNYIKVRLPGEPECVNHIAALRLGAVGADGVMEATWAERSAAV